MTELAEQRACLAAVESTYGTIPTLLATDAILLREDAERVPLQAEYRDRRLVRGYLGASEEVPVNKHTAVRFPLEFAGSGTVDTPPAWGRFLRAAGFAETINAATSVVYNPISSAFESIGGNFHMDANRHDFSGVRGSGEITFAEGDFPILDFQGVGIFNQAAEAALPTTNFTGWKSPLPVDKTNTTTITLHGQAVVLSRLSINLGNNTSFKNRPNQEEAQLTDRNVTGTAVFEAIPRNTIDWDDIAIAQTLGVLALVHGIGAGNIIQIDAPKVQIKNPRYSTDDGTLMTTVELVFVPDAGNDELTITTK